MTKFDFDRTKNYTNAEFNAIERDAYGNICCDLDLHLIYMTEAQRERLSEDDWSRAIVYDEEMRCLMAEAAIEFGIA
jgi:hypothetical protein